MELQGYDTKQKQKPEKNYYKLRNRICETEGTQQILECVWWICEFSLICSTDDKRETMP